MEVGVAYMAVGALGAIGGALGLAVAADAPTVVEESPALGDQETRVLETSCSEERAPPKAGMVAVM